MHFKISWAGRARIEMSSAIAYMAERDPGWASTCRSKISERSDALKTAPYVSSIFRSDSPIGEIREVLAGGFRIFFTVNEQRKIITIRRIFHVRQADPDFEE